MAETIAAISTALAPSGIGIVRISGPEALSIGDTLFKGKKDKKISEQKGNTIHYGWISYNGEILDEVLVSVFREPHSYTGEDSIEINCHGGIIAINRILNAVYDCGAAPAGPGEFTKRAFLNGRMDLSRAEAVMDVISAKSEYALQSSVSQLRGGLNKRITEVREKILYELAYIESALDDPEHISLDGYPEHLLQVIKTEKEKLNRLRNTAEKGKYIEEGIKTVILGKPNVGKSSLLNMLSGKKRAIVTDIPGTTRDVLEETVQIGKMALKMLDTAGIRESDNQVEQIGVQLAWEKADEADLILYVIDSSLELDNNDREILNTIKDKNIIVLLNKTDKGKVVKTEEINNICDFPVLEISAKEGTGEEELKNMIQDMFFSGEISFNDEVYITNARHKQLLEEAVKNIELVEQSINDGMPEDFYSIDMMGAIEALNGIIGGNLSEDLVDEIFSKFCTGK